MNDQQKQLSLKRPRIFLSYAKEDEGKVRSIHRRLKNEQLNPWLDLDDLLPGQDWDRTIVNAIRDSRFIIVFLSTHSVNKRGYVQKEIREALDLADRMPEGELFIIPVRLEECVVPDRLSKWHWIDLYRSGGFKKLISTIKTELGIDINDLPQRHKPNTIPLFSIDEIGDLLLADAIAYGGTFLHARDASGKVAISNGHFLEFIKRLPKFFQEVKNRFPSRRKFTTEQVSLTLSILGAYRKDENLLKEIIPFDKYAYVLVSRGNNRCGINRKYMHYIQLKYPEGKLYLQDKHSPIVVEEGEEIRFIVMPFIAE